MEGTFRNGILLSDTEKDQQERKAERGTKKAKRRKDRAQKEADEKLVGRLEPASSQFSKKYENKEIAADLQKAKSRGKILEGTEDKNKDYNTSGKFFARMQEGIRDELKGGGKKKDVLGGKKKGSAAFML